MVKIESFDVDYLVSPVRLDLQSWPEGAVPLVSISCLTYNHAKFIRECLDGFLMQETIFPVEILVHDDASTDSTVLIIEEYAQKYPHLIKPIYQSENQYSKKINPNITYNYPRVSGQYIAFCEGDDYWTDPLKLQKQVDFLESNPKYVFCWTRFKTLDEKTKEVAPDQNRRYFSDGAVGVDVGFSEFLKGWHVGTQTIVFRTKEIFENNNFHNPFYRDVFLIADLLNLGKGFCISDFTAVYRKHMGGIYTKTSSLERAKNGAEIYKAIFQVYPENIYLQLKYKKFSKVYIDILVDNGQYKEALRVLGEEISLTVKYNLQKECFIYRVSEIISKNNQELSILRNIISGWSFKIGRLVTFPWRFISNIANNRQRKKRFASQGYEFIDKKNILKNYKNLRKCISNKNHRLPQLIVSLTSFPERIHDLFYTLCSILNQSLPPNRIVLWLAKDQFPNGENDLPPRIVELKKFGVFIEWCSDLKSYKKLVPSLQKYPNDIIVTADDDIYYPFNWLELLYSSYLKDPSCVHCHRAHRITFDEKKSINDYKKWIFELKTCNKSYKNFFTTGGGVLFPPHILFDDVCDDAIFTQVCPTADDIWFWAMTVLNSVKIVVVEDNISELVYVDPMKQFGNDGFFSLYTLNVLNGHNDFQLNSVINFYEDRKLIKKIISDGN